MNEYIKKIAYFYHASIQGCGAYPNAAAALRLVSESGRLNGLLADGQCFTPAQIHKAMLEQDPGFDIVAALPVKLRTLSSEVKAKKAERDHLQSRRCLAAGQRHCSGECARSRFEPGPGHRPGEEARPADGPLRRRQSLARGHPGATEGPPAPPPT